MDTSDRVHLQYVNKCVGNTTHILISAIQNTVVANPLVIVGYSYSWCLNLLQQTIKLATEMGYSVVRKSELRLLIDDVPVEFCPREELERYILGRNCVVFEDHYKPAYGVVTATVAKNCSVERGDLVVIRDDGTVAPVNSKKL